jgi:monoamine oxidase
VNWRVREGFGTLLAKLAEGLPIAFGAVVSVVDHRGRRIQVRTSRGVVSAERVIITVPTTSIAGEHLRFDPLLPEKVAAAANLPLGVTDKLFLRLDGELSGIEEHVFLVGSTRRRDTMNYQVCPMGRPRIQCFFGGRFAAELERAGMGAMVAFATDELAELFGHDIRRRLTPLAASFWRADPYALGSYSYAVPGYADDRAVLAAPVDGRLFFAGEACSRIYFSTVHGAYESGIAAAEAVLNCAPPD